MSKDPHIANLFSAEEEDCLSLEQMTAYQRGQLAGPAKHVVERHLLDCELCALTYESMAEVGAESLAAGAAEVSDRAWDKVQALSERKRRGAFYWVASAAAVALLIMVGYITMSGPSETDMAKSFAEGMELTPPRPTPADPTEGIAMVDERPEGELPAELNQKMGQKTIEENTATATSAPKDMANGSSGMKMNRPALEDLRPQMGAPLSDGKDAVKGGTMTAKESIKAPSPMPAPSAKPALGAAPAVAAADNSLSEIDDAVVDGESGADFDDYYSAGKRDDRDRTSSEEVVATVAESKAYKEKTNKKESAGADKSMAPSSYKRDENHKAKPTPEGRATAATTPAKSGDESERLSSFDQGIIDYREGNYREAAQELRLATEQTPSNLDAHIYAADAFLRISQPQAALFHIERILAVPGSTHIEDAEWYKALAYLQLKDAGKARKQLEKVIARGGKHKAAAEKALNELK